MRLLCVTLRREIETMKTATSMRHALAAARAPAVRVAGRRAASSVAATAGRRVTATGSRRTTTAAPLALPGTRTFSVGARRQEEAFDPATVERESDEVDVCIVGGGMYLPLQSPLHAV